MTSSPYETSTWPEAPAIARAHGFCIVRNFFEPGAVARWEAAACALPEVERLKDFLTLPPFDALVLDERVLNLARALIGPELVYYGETSFSLGAPPFRTWHCDARGLPEDLEALYDPTGEVYPGWRFAIYFRDYRGASGGLKVGPGSHRRSLAEMLNRGRTSVTYTSAAGSMKLPTPLFPVHNVTSAPGDLVIFNLRTFHSAGALLLKENHQAQLLPDLEAQMLARYAGVFEPDAPGARNALFFDLGAPAAALDLYIKWRAAHIWRDPKLHPPMWQQTVRDTALGVYAYDRPETRRAAEERGIVLRYDRIIAQLLYKRDLLGALAPEDQARLELLVKTNREFSPYHSLVKAA